MSFIFSNLGLFYKSWGWGMKYIYIIFLFITLNSILNCTEPVGKWTFNDESNLGKAEIGTDLIQNGTITSAYSEELTKWFVTVAKGSFFKCSHNIKPKGTEVDINEYSLLFDFKVRTSGQYYCFLQTNLSNTNDGEIFINPAMKIGISATGYSGKTVSTDQWYRLVVSVKNDEIFNYYLDGELILQGTAQSIDGRFSLDKDSVLFFADEDGEDNEIDISQVQIFDKALTNEEVNQLGKFEHTKYKILLPYLQTATDSSIYICWHNSLPGLQSKVEYKKVGDTNTYIAEAEYIEQDSTTYWYSAYLGELEPETKYSYKCYSGELISDEYTFYSFPVKEKKTGHIRMVLMSDCQTNANVFDSVSSSVKKKLIELYGNDYSKEVNLIFFTGDIVGDGSNLESYYTEFFKPIAKLACNIPIMACIGNHELESQYYYNYMKTQQFAGPEGNLYYRFSYGPISIYALNSIRNTNTQLQWYKNRTKIDNTNDKTLFIFSFLHYPSHSEIWPDGNSNWVYSELDPLMKGMKKSVLKANGHSHCYERGALLDSGNTYTLTIGGAGGGLDRWGAYPNQTDYQDVQKSLDVHHWVLIDVDLQDSSFKGYTYSLGNTDKPADNELIDTFSYKVKNDNYPQATVISPEGIVANPFIIKSEYPINYDSIYCVEVMVEKQIDPMLIMLDTVICKDDYYGNSGSPDFITENLNKNIDFRNLTIPIELIPFADYTYKIRYRDINLNWSDYSVPKHITAEAFSVNEQNLFSAKIINTDNTYIELFAPESGNINICISDLLAREKFKTSMIINEGITKIPISDYFTGFAIIKIDYYNYSEHNINILKAIK